MWIFEVYRTFIILEQIQYSDGIMGWDSFYLQRLFRNERSCIVFKIIYGGA